jgi:hypothetical protein
MATPLGHSIVGYMVARAAGVRSPKTMALAVGAANLPDIDFVAGYISNGDMESMHQSVITHRPAFPFIVGAATGLAAIGLSLLRGRRPGAREVLKPAALATALVSTHVMMDPLPLPYDSMPGHRGTQAEVVATQAWNAVIDMAVYGTMAVLISERNGKTAEA